MTSLTRSKDRKVANAVTPKGAPALANAFGLPAGRGYSCPDATDYCSKICYAGKIEKIYPGVSNVLIRNFEALQSASYEDMQIMISDMITEFVKECDRRGFPKHFRIHWDGDFFSGTYVAAWSKVIASFPDVMFWVYTRVPTAATYLHKQRLDNLSLYFSADRDNINQARTLKSFGIRIAYVDDTFAQGKEQFPSAVRCPENNKAIKLADANGSACEKCGLCIFGRNDVLFSKGKK